jgi:hypothetical protein
MQTDHAVQKTCEKKIKALKKNARFKIYMQEIKSSFHVCIQFIYLLHFNIPVNYFADFKEWHIFYLIILKL